MFCLIRSVFSLYLSHLYWQIQKEKLQLFAILTQVPNTIVKHLSKLAQAGYEKMKQQLSGDADANDDDGMESVANCGTEFEVLQRPRWACH